MDRIDKIFVSCDMNALFTNVLVEGALQAVEKTLNNIEDEDLPVPRNDYLNLVNLCVDFGVIAFNNEEFRQLRGLAIGSALSPVMASLCMKN